MYDNLKDLINSKNYELKDILYKINIVWTKRYITTEQMEELEELARQNAVAENSYAPLQEQIKDIYSKLAQITSRVNALENQEGTGEEEPTEPVEEYPEFVQPTGAHDAYHVGDKITYNGKKYICKLDNCVWDPDTYPQGWEEVVEDTVESEG